MCGVFAVYSSHPVNDLEGLLHRSAGALQHRGPDDQGFYCSPNNAVGLAHRRLSVMDPHKGKQPLNNERRSVFAVVNGEFYDYQTLRRQLERRSHRFATNSDSEILVHLYEEFGVECLAHLRGEFAFVLWDNDRQHLFAARDRFGIKPLQYHHQNTNETLMVSSEAKALFAAGLQSAWDQHAFSFAASSQYLPADRTLFHGIEMLPPGHYLLASDRELTVRQYWKIPEPIESLNLSQQDLVAACRTQVEDAVKCRLRADAPVCFQLSGGLDSSTVAGIAARSVDGPIDVFSIGFPETAYSESEVAERTALSLAANLHRVDICQQALMNALPAAVKASEGLSINGHVAAKNLMHQRMRESGFKVVLTGEGADEAFFGYGHLRVDYWDLEGFDIAQHLLHQDRTSRGMMLACGSRLPLSVVKERLGFIPHWVAAKANLASKLNQLLRPDFQRSFDSQNRTTEMLAPYFKGAPNVADARDAWTNLAMAGYILKTLGDGTEMPHSIEGRVPFLDHKLWEFLASVPQDVMFCRNRDKPLLRDSAQPLVTKEVYQRSKHPFDAPPLAVFSGKEGQHFMMDMLRSDEARAQPFFCPARIEEQLVRTEEQPEEQQLLDPALMIFLSTLFLQQLFSQSPGSESR